MSVRPPDAAGRRDEGDDRRGAGGRPRQRAGAAGEALAGAGLLARGLSLIARRPRLFVLGAIPPLITSTLFVIVLVLLIGRLDEIAVALTPFADGWSAGLADGIRVLAGVAVLGGSILLMVVSFTTLTLALGSPLYDKLSEAVEAEFGPVPELEEPAGRGIWRAVRQSAALIGVSLLGAVLLFGLGLVPLLGQVVTAVLSALFGGWMLGIELIGSAFERRGRLTIAERRAAMRGRRARVLGFAVPTFLLLAVPFAGAVVFPIATAGGTLLARQLLRERTEPGGPPTAGRRTAS